MFLLLLSLLGLAALASVLDDVGHLTLLTRAIPAPTLLDDLAASAERHVMRMALHPPWDLAFVFRDDAIADLLTRNVQDGVLFDQHRAAQRTTDDLVDAAAQHGFVVAVVVLVPHRGIIAAHQLASVVDVEAGDARCADVAGCGCTLIQLADLPERIAVAKQRSRLQMKQRHGCATKALNETLQTAFGLLRVGRFPGLDH